jgi:hypothetical protein
LLADQYSKEVSQGEETLKQLQEQLKLHNVTDLQQRQSELQQKQSELLVSLASEVVASKSRIAENKRLSDPTLSPAEKAQVIAQEYLFLKKSIGDIQLMPDFARLSMNSIIQQLEISSKHGTRGTIVWELAQKEIQKIDAQEKSPQTVANPSAEEAFFHQRQDGSKQPKAGDLDDIEIEDVNSQGSGRSGKGSPPDEAAITPAKPPVPPTNVMQGGGRRNGASKPSGTNSTIGAKVRSGKQKR